ncbi:DUF4345 domain-containing protein [Inquilinus sp. OTU3971]|uniref:DUF4345 domain-containing protein n=1 Tax=Inquilinus sp. OTU3971 TaxID=3043855 RepID=UPI00406C1B20
MLARWTNNADSRRRRPIARHDRNQCAIWLGFGLVLWWISNDPLHRAAAARLLFAILFVSGLARLYALVRWGFPGPLLAGAIAIELVLSPIPILWLNRLQQHSRS